MGKTVILIFKYSGAIPWFKAKEGSLSANGSPKGDRTKIGIIHTDSPPGGWTFQLNAVRISMVKVQGIVVKKIFRQL